MKNITHQQEIESSRVGGFGSSDAAMFYRLGNGGMSALTQTDLRRIAVAKGQIPYIPIPQNDAMNAGHLFELHVAKYMKYPHIREKKLEQFFTPKFRTFSHVDFWNNFTKVAYECKYSQKTTEQVMLNYIWQFGWHKLMGASDVILIHGSGSVSPFEVHNQVKSSIDLAGIPEILLEGINILAENWELLDTIELRKDVTLDDLLPIDRRGIQMMTSALSKIKALEEQAKSEREKILRLFEDNNIKSLKSEAYTLSYVGPTVKRTFDKEAFAKDHPEINLKAYDKITPVKSQLKITLK